MHEKKAELIVFVNISNGEFDCFHCKCMFDIYKLREQNIEGTSSKFKVKFAVKMLT